MLENRRYRLAARTTDSQSVNRGSIPRTATFSGAERVTSSATYPGGSFFFGADVVIQLPAFLKAFRDDWSQDGDTWTITVGAGNDIFQVC